MLLLRIINALRKLEHDYDRMHFENEARRKKDEAEFEAFKKQCEEHMNTHRNGN